MPREITFAILIGFVLGLLIMFGVYTANRAIKEQGQEAKTEAAPTATPSPPIKENFLNITEPADEELFSQSKVTISGKTKPQAVVAILTETEELFIEADEEGFFSEEIELEAGATLVKLVSTDSFGSQAEATLTLTYSTKIVTETETDEKE